MRTAYILGRILLPLVFIVAGIQKLLNVQGVAGMLAKSGIPVPDEVSGYLGGMPKYEALGYAVGGLELVGGLMIVFGVAARWGALVLVVFTAAATFMFHNFWDMTGEAASQNQIQALKNLSIMGGLLLVAGMGSGTQNDGRAMR